MPEDTNAGTARLPEAPVRIAAIAAGGSLGTLGRYGTERLFAVPEHAFPWPTFLVNVVGSFLLGLVVTLVVERWPPTRFVRPFAAIGFCGGFTTFSTMVVEAAQRGQHGQVGLAVGYLAASLTAGLAAGILGMAAARGRFTPAGLPIPDPDDTDMLGPPTDGAGG